jgi:hypothetical protein
MPDISVTPASHDYGTVVIGDTASQTFTVENLGDADLEVASTVLTGLGAGSFQVVSGGGGFTLAPGGQRMIEIEFSPATVGTKDADLEIASNDPDTPVLTVPLTGAAVEGGGSVLEIPTVSPAGLAALAALLLVLGLAMLRRRTA